MDQDEREAIREDMLRDQHHEYMMRTDIEYFCEHTVENLYLTPDDTSGVYLFDIIERLRQECNNYNQNIDDLLDYMKGV
jgi:hypothetical protein